MLPKSVLAKAVSYAQNQWQALRRYTTDGRLSIDNNVSERTLRHQAIGRKNWLFLGSRQAGPRAAVLFTILAGAKRHRIEPWTYLRELLLRLHDDDSRLDEMLPDKWAANHPESVLTYRLEESRRKAAAQEHAPPSRTRQPPASLTRGNRIWVGRTLTRVDEIFLISDRLGCFRPSDRLARRASHPLEIAEFSRRTPILGIRENG